MRDLPSLLQLYTSLVRPHLEYATQVWDPSLIKDIQKLESVQKFAFKLCCKRWDTSYSENLYHSLLPELSFRRKYLSLSYFYNLIHGHFEFPDMPATLRQPTYSTRSSHATINFMFNLSLTLILFFTLSSPRPFHYGTPFHPISCFSPLCHLLNVANLYSYLH